VVAGAVSGSLLSHDFLTAAAEHILPGARMAVPGMAARDFDRQRATALLALGPASAPRAVFNLCGRPLAAWLGWIVPDGEPARHAMGWWTPLTMAASDAVIMLAVEWDRSLATADRAAASLALVNGTRWALLTNGRAARLVSATRTASGAALEFDLERCRVDSSGLACLRAVCGADAFRHESAAGGTTRLDRAIVASERQGVRVCESLQQGVRESLTTLGAAMVRARRRVTRDVPPAAAQTLTAVYRILFLLFAEARGLVPAWHSVYRHGYTLAALAARIESDGDARGTWAALQAMARLAHAGCTSGDLHVVPFNGRLFAPTAAPLLDHLPLADGPVILALSSLLFTTEAGRRRRICYADLGVEQLGSVYERLLDDPHHAPAVRGHSSRKSTGTFYTPRALTDYLVRVTLAPLVEGRSSSEILNLRVLDPAMGSGAFLVAACHCLASAVERALVDEGEIGECDVDESLRAGLRRRVAQRCLFGVDLNPMAVQLAQLSLWLATLSAEHPLSFLDHHIRCGDSLIGASPVDLIARRPGFGSRVRLDTLPMEQFFDHSEQLASLLPLRARLEDRADDSIAIVRDKEQTLATLARHPVLGQWRRACDVWCAAALPGGREVRPVYAALLDEAFGRPPQAPETLRAAAAAIVGAMRESSVPFHWPLEFPEVFLDGNGRARADGGFDAIVGNPPWEMLRADSGSASTHAALASFARMSGVYLTPDRGHRNQYQLFVERAMSLLRPGGRIGVLVPSGLLTDAVASGIRRLLVDRHGLESIAVFDNRRAIFPIHRSLRFAAITAVRDGRTTGIRCRFGLDSVDQTPALEPQRGDSFPVRLTPALLHSLSGTALAFPDLPSARDLVLVERLAAQHKALSDPAGWGVTFGRELNASDDRDCLTDRPRPDDLIVIEGKHLEAFRARLDLAPARASRGRVARRLGQRAAVVDEPRLAYREVAASTNRTTLIAAILPPGTVSVHTVFCRRGKLPSRDERVLCALLNSYVANYWVRRWVTLHVTATVMARLPVPCPAGGLFEELEAAYVRLAAGPVPDMEARFQAACAVAYGLDREAFAHILETFPLVQSSARRDALEAFAHQ
jgi:Eco57I restriction-modification methylase